MDIDLVGRHQIRSKAVGEVLPLGRSQPTLHLAHLDITGAEVVEDGIPRDIIHRLGRRYVPPLLADNGAELELVIQLFGILRPFYLAPGAND